MDDTLRSTEETIRLKRGIERLNAGDPSVRGELINIATQRLIGLTSHLRGEFQGLDDGRSSNEIFQSASLRLYQALHEAPIQDVRHFYRMAAIHIRRELIQICNDCQALGPAANEARSDVAAAAADGRISPEELQGWAHFHHTVDALPQTEREVFELIWYHEMSREEAADLLGLPIHDVRRLWRSARLNLHEQMGEEEFAPSHEDP